ncbi:hypothetical protein OIU34_18305 [Pararhizobium sp. BT-229]|uniref:hypothetical protein n=1 Tax=Pararhizobium sp. BT-229 TaxID=2986923 RepID=UPI0021F6B987|nr:hypothetical protein [Pararhizobium sp. BT-229]MCV9963833.1 hypothetical protein [Pararhizobium sp. BT-229]
MDVPSVLPPLPPLPPNFASSPEELVKSSGLNVVIESVLPTLRVSIVTELGYIPLYFDIPPPRSQGRYDEF